MELFHLGENGLCSRRTGNLKFVFQHLLGHDGVMEHIIGGRHFEWQPYAFNTSLIELFLKPVILNLGPLLCILIVASWCVSPCVWPCNIAGGVPLMASQCNSC